MQSSNHLWLPLATAIFTLVCVEAQRGCPSDGCDPRGLNCQADFQVDGTKADIVWQLSIGNVSYQDDQSSLGCVGNDANVICKFNDGHQSGFVSADGMTGKERWRDNLMQNPRQPIMNSAGDIIATDGRFMEMRLNNGSLVGKPLNFVGHISDTSSIQYALDPVLFFFVSYKSGGIYLYDTSGMCVASTFLDVKDPNTNQTVSVWKPISRLVVNTEMDPPCTYFLARNNVTKDLRLYAVNFNHQPPYLLEKWHLHMPEYVKSDVNGDVSAQSRIICRGNTLLYGSMDLKYTMVIRDDQVSGMVQTKLNMTSLSFASFDLPVNSGYRESDTPPIFWLNSLGEWGDTTLYGWVNEGGVNGTFKYAINLSDMFNITLSEITSELMIFGYHEDDTTLVFAFTGVKFPPPGSNESGDNQGNQIAALKPLPNGKVDLLWKITIGGDNFVTGQIIGHKEDMLLAVSLGTPYNLGNRLLGIKIAP